MIDELTRALAEIERLKHALQTLEAFGLQAPVRASPRIEFRRVYNEVNCTPWKKVPDLFTSWFHDLHEYLSGEYGDDPDLKNPTYATDVWQDKYNLQYRNVLLCTSCEGGGWRQVYSQHPPAFEKCDTCGNPMDYPCP